MKKIFKILLIFVIVITAAYLYIRFSVLKVKDFKPDTSKSKSVLDLRPAIIAKLQQLIKDGSNGLYHLTIEDIKIHDVISKVDILHADIVPDTIALKKLDSAHLLPDDMFKISFSSLHIDGINLNDLLSRNHITLKYIFIAAPVIEIYHKPRWYNKEKRISKDTATLYQKIMKNMKSIAVDKIAVMNGAIIYNNLSKRKQANRFNDVSIDMQHILIDSSTQFDKNRFLFATHADVLIKNFIGKTPDSLYFFKCEAVNISTEKNNIIMHQFELHARGDKKWFESKLKTRKEMWNLVIPEITLKNINWWQLINKKRIIAKEGIINNGTCKVYLDRSLPFRKVKQKNFPHQMLMRIPIPLYIASMQMLHSNLSYTEYNPGTAKSGTIYINELNARISNITNMRSKIKRNRWMTIKSTGIFMHNVPLKNKFQFDLSKYKTGDFTMDLDIGKMDSSILNPIAGPMGEFIIKRGIIQRGIAHEKGNNFKATGHGVLLYKDLYLVAVKKDNDNPGHLKKKSILSFFANVLLIKNSNPSKIKPPRYEDFSSDRGPLTTFMSLVWKTIYIGILKSIGLPPKFADKKY